MEFLVSRKKIAMSCSTRCYLLLITVALLLQNAIGADPLYHICSSTDTFAANTPYQSNLNTLISSLPFRAPSSGFGHRSVGRDPDQAYGLALCRGDVSAADCKTCIVGASSEIQKRCPSNKAAIIWYDQCLVKYSNKAFFGQIDNGNKIYMWSTKAVSDPVGFNGQTKELLTELATFAYGTRKMYGRADGPVDNTTSRLYGIVQCTRDLTSDDCKKCLDGIIGELPRCCAGKEGGRVVSGSCNFRYETYPFVSA